MVADSIDNGLLVLFIGFNPSPASAQAGHPYAHRSNRFYRILHESGLTPVLHPPADYRAMLPLYGYGFTNIVARTTRRADELSASEYALGKQVVIAKLARYQPAVACFVGKGVYLPYAGRKTCSYGFQAARVLPGVHEFVGPATSGLVRMPYPEQLAIYEELAAFVKALRDESEPV